MAIFVWREVKIRLLLRGARRWLPPRVRCRCVRFPALCGSAQGARCVSRHGGSAIVRLPSPPAASPSARPAPAASLVSGNRPRFHGDYRGLARRALDPAPARKRWSTRPPGLRLRRGVGAVLSSRAVPHPHPLRHAVSSAFARLASSRFASLARSVLRALESSPVDQPLAAVESSLDRFRPQRNLTSQRRWAKVRGRRSGRRELARRRAPLGYARRGGCGCGAARDDSIAPHPRRRRPTRAPRRPAISAGAGARRPLRQPRARREARTISGNKAKGPRENARTAPRQGATAIWRLPRPRDASRNARFRTSP